ncbi:MAG: glycosyltransferase family 9 protein [Bacteroidales bacterium]
MQKIRFLIIRFSSIGDVVLTTPVVRCLKNQVEGAEIHYLTKPAFRKILENNPYIDKVHVLQPSFADTIHQLKYEHFDYIIDLHKNLRSFRVKNRLKVISFSFHKLNKEKWLMVNFKKNKLPDKHIVDRYLETLSVFDVQNDQQGLDYFIPDRDHVNLNTLSDELAGGYVGVVVGAYHNTKKMPSEKIVSICRKTDKPVVLLGGPKDREEAEKIKNAVGTNIFNTCGKYNSANTLC